MSCNPTTEIPDGLYPDHMKVVHQNKPQSSEIKPLDPNAEIEQTLKEIADFEKQKKSQEKPKSLPPPAEKMPLELTYKYVGNCENGHGVDTLENDLDNRHFVVAYCLQCHKQLQSREVVNLRLQTTIKESPPFSESGAEIEPTIMPSLHLADKSKKKQKIEPLPEVIPAQSDG